MLCDDFLAYYEAAWSLRAGVMRAIMKEETSLSRVMARFAAFENAHEVVLLNERVHYRGKTSPDPISLLESPVQAISCGVTVPGFNFSRTDLGGLISSLAADCDTVLELGSGWGHRLFETWLAGGPKEARYIGLEPSASGRLLAEQLAALEPDMTLVSVAGDLSDFDVSGLCGRKILLFTCFTVMFAPDISIKMFERIASINGDVLCVFIEPIGFQISAADNMAKRQIDAATARNFNRNFFDVFNQAARQGLIEPLFVGRDLFGLQHDPLTQASIILASKS